MKMLRTPLMAGLLAMAPVAVSAMDLHLPVGANLAKEVTDDFGSYRLPISGWENGRIETIWAEGAISQQAWRIEPSDQTTLQLLETLRGQMALAGFDVLFECDAAACGGFDFRFDTEVLAEPEMHVDLGDFRFLSAQRMGKTRPEYISLIISRSATASYVQIMRVGDAAANYTPLTTTTKTAPIAADLSEMAKMLEVEGYAVLEDLSFATGSSKLEGSEFATLQALADYLIANPSRTVALVGHTDAEGSLGGNVSLSKKRAGSVVSVLVNELGVNANQVSAEGMGFLAPRASNLTDEGRDQNRRVEVILTSTN